MNKRLFCVAILVSILLSGLAWKRTDGFCLSLIQGPLLPQPAPSASADILMILEQPFHYLGKGRQCFVFESADRKSVIKFFNQPYTQMPWYAKRLLSQEGKKREVFKRAQRKKYYLSSYLLADRELKKETGLLYVHQGSSSTLLPSLHLVDQASREWEVDLNQIPFVLQKKGHAFYEALQEALEKEGTKKICSLIDRYLVFLGQRMEKKIADADQDTEHNLGLLEGSVCLLDPGRLYREEQLQDPRRQKEEWERATRQLRSWLQSHDPAACAYLDERLQLLKEDGSKFLGICPE